MRARSAYYCSARQGRTHRRSERRRCRVRADGCGQPQLVEKARAPRPPGHGYRGRQPGQPAPRSNKETGSDGRAGTAPGRPGHGRGSGGGTARGVARESKRTGEGTDSRETPASLTNPVWTTTEPAAVLFDDDCVLDKRVLRSLLWQLQTDQARSTLPFGKSRWLTTQRGRTPEGAS